MDENLKKEILQMVGENKIYRYNGTSMDDLKEIFKKNAGGSFSRFVKDGYIFFTCGSAAPEHPLIEEVK